MDPRVTPVGTPGLTAAVPPGSGHTAPGAPPDTALTGIGSAGQGAAAPPVLGHPPPMPAASRADEDDADARQRRAEERKRRARRDRIEEEDIASAARRPAGVQGGRIVERLGELLKIVSPPGREGAAAAWVRAHAASLGFAVREDGAGALCGSDCGNLVVEIGQPEAPTLLLVARLACEDVPQPGAVHWTGSELVASERAAGLHARAGLAILAEVLDVLADLRNPPCRLRLVYVLDGEMGQAGARALEPDVMAAAAAFCLDGFLADEILHTRPPTGGGPHAAQSARTARQEAERMLRDGVGVSPLDATADSGADLRGRLERCLARVGQPAWSGFMPPAGTSASVLLARGVPSVVVGTGVMGAHAAGETLSLSDAVLCARLLLAVAETFRAAR